jgi:heme exporter protein B
MKSFIRQFRVLVIKDVRREARRLEVVTTTVAFAMLMVVIFTFAFFHDPETVRLVFPGILWVSVIFTGTLVMNHGFASERQNGCLRALALVPGTRTSLYYAKLCTGVITVVFFESLLLPLLFLVFAIDPGGEVLTHLAIILSGTFGFVAIGTLLSAMLVHHRMQNVLLPILLYTLATPLLIAGVKGTSVLVDGNTQGAAWDWFKVMCGVDLLFIGLAQVLFEWILEAIE